MNTPNAAALLHERYGIDPFKPDRLWNETLMTLLSHRSVRAYRPDSLPAQTLEVLVAAAQSAATSSNLQTWSVVAIEDPVRKETLAQLAGNQAQIRQCPLFLVWLADLARLHQLALQRGLPADGLDYLEMFLTATIDATLAAQNATIAAESLGLGTVYIGGIRNQPEALRQRSNYRPICLLSLGCVLVILMSQNRLRSNHGYPKPPFCIEKRMIPRHKRGRSLSTTRSCNSFTPRTT